MTRAGGKELTIPAELAGWRLDAALSQMLPEHSRSRLQQWIDDGCVSLNGARPVRRQRVYGREHIRIEIPDRPLEGLGEPQDIELSLLYEDESLLVFDKPAGQVMHPAAGNRDGTVQNALLHHYPELAAIPRAGIVHRLDKDTTGVFVVARTLQAHTSLVEQLQSRSMGRQYLAVVHGALVAGGTVDAPIGRHARDRKRMAIRDNGRPAITHYRVRERFAEHTALSVRLESGRTHQIRVHMTSIQHPLIGDQTYGGRRRIARGRNPQAVETVSRFPRQALHAERLHLLHPGSRQPVEFSTALPEDLHQLLAALRSLDTQPQSGESAKT